MEKKRMENKMQDSKRTRYLGTYVHHEGRWYLLQEDVEEILNSEISKAREEVLYEIKDEIFFGEVAENLGEKISKERIKNIIDDKLSKLTTK